MKTFTEMTLLYHIALEQKIKVLKRLLCKYKPTTYIDDLAERQWRTSFVNNTVVRVTPTTVYTTSYIKLFKNSLSL